MRALVYTAPHEIQLLDHPEPTAASHEAIVSVRGAGICGSELEGFAQASPFRVPPLVMGHEFAGELTDGTRVVVNPIVACGSCDLCARGQPNLCRTRELIGVHRDGGFAERVAVPAANCIPLPDSVSWIQAAVIEPVANAVHALGLALACEPAPARLGVVGGGTLGMCTALVAQRMTGADVVVADLSESRQLAAAASGVQAGPRLDGEFDVVVDAVGRDVTRRAAAEHLRPGGAAIWLGLHDEQAGVDGRAVVRGEHRILGAFAYTGSDFLTAIGIIESLDVSWAITAELDDGVAVFERLVAGDQSAVKTVLVP